MRRLSLLFIILFSLFLRLYNLSHIPNGFYWDEQDTSYQAFSLLTTGRDYYNNQLPLFPHSFADYRTPVNIYLTVPLVKLFGLSILPSRLTAAILGLLTIPIVYLLTKKNLLATFFIAFSPWHFLFSRYNGEISAMIFFIFTGLLLFYRKRPYLSMLFFALSVASYSPAKFFTPILIIYLFISQLPLLKLKPYVLFFVICIPLVFSTTGGSRFHDLAIFTDPQLANTVDYQRKLRLLSRDPNPPVGSSPSLIDKVFVNKYSLLADTFFTNYLSNFSTDFLFIKGDQNLRHSTGLGQMYFLDALLLIVGFVFLFKNRQMTTSFKVFILLLLAIAPIPASLTRDGAAHAGRAALLLIPFTLLISQIRFYRPLNLLFNLIYIISVFNFIQHFSSYYRVTSAKYFDYGYDQAIALAVNSNYHQVWLDFHHDSPLMAYLFYAKVSPKQFQASLPLKSIDLGQGIAAYKFGNVYTLLPGERNYSVQTPPKDTLVIAKTEHEPALIRYPNHLPEFQTFIF